MCTMGQRCVAARGVSGQGEDHGGHEALCEEVSGRREERRWAYGVVKMGAWCLGGGSKEKSEAEGGEASP